MYKATGKLHVIKKEQKVSDKFKKREFVLLMDENPQYPQMILFQMTQDRCDLLDQYKVGDIVDVSFDLKGREWANAQGDVKYFNTLNAFKIFKAERREATQNPTKDGIEINGDQDLPF